MVADIRALRREWYAILASEGFEDIETLTPRGNLYSEISKGRVRSKDLDPIRIQQRADYYRRASQFTWEFIFPDELTRSIWALHAEGETYRVIAEQNGISLRRVHAVVNAIARGPFASYRFVSDTDEAFSI